MGGKRNRSGPPGNTNASKYGWRVLVRRALIRPKDAWVNRPVDAYIHALLSDKADPSGAEQHAIEVAGTAKACSLLILNELKQSGFTCTIKGALELTPAARELSRFLTVELSALKLLRLERRARAPITLGEYLHGTGKPPAEQDTQDVLNVKAAPVQPGSTHDATVTTDEATPGPTPSTTQDTSVPKGPTPPPAPSGPHTKEDTP